VVFLIFVLSLLNSGIKRYWLKSALTQSELLIIYSTLSVSSALSGESVGQQLVRLISAPFWLATPENEWSSLFHRYLSGWLVIDHRRVLQAFFENTDGRYTPLDNLTPIDAWLRPLMMWSAFTAALAFLMTCANVILRKQWVEHEKLAYPVIQLPLVMTIANYHSFLHGRIWTGFGLGAGITLINGWHHLNPMVPGIQNIYNSSHLFVSKPWSSINPVVLAFYPCAVGLAYFMPLDLAFSTWFFFLFWKAQLVGGAIFGFVSISGFPYAKWQQTGAYLSIGILTLWASRQQIFHVFSLAFKIDGNHSKPLFSQTDSAEPMSYRMAGMGLVFAFILIITFGVQAGMSVWVASFFFGIYLMLSLTVTRLRAELGPLVHELYYSNTGQVMTAVWGTSRLSSGNLASMSLFWWLTRSQNSHFMPHQLEAFKLARQTNTPTRWWWSVMLLAAVLGLLACSYAVLDLGSSHGNNAGFAPEAYRRLQSWISHPQPPHLAASGFMSFGFLFTLFLLSMKRHFLWWPFHPLGYAVTQGDWAITYIWFSIFVSWSIKVILLDYRGLRSHRQATPIFMGLILGDFIMGVTWGLIGLSTGITTCQFKNW
jgi:hypothetical protein